MIWSTLAFLLVSFGVFVTLLAALAALLTPAGRAAAAAGRDAAGREADRRVVVLSLSLLIRRIRPIGHAPTRNKKPISAQPTQLSSFFLGAFGRNEPLS